MQTSAFLAEASGRYGSLLFVLFLASAIAALIWLILWMLSESESEAGSEELGSEADSADGGAPVTEDEDASDSEDDSGEEVNAEEKGTGTEDESQEVAASADDSEPKSDASSEDKDSGEEEDEFRAASEEEAARLFADDLASGIVKQDPVYSIIYSEAPDEVDDLKKIKGVAKVLEGKLNGIGVYRFKQVAVWTDSACQEFSKLLTFKNRIYSDNWIAQAKTFHEEKYDEKL